MDGNAFLSSSAVLYKEKEIQKERHRGKGMYNLVHYPPKSER